MVWLDWPSVRAEDLRENLGLPNFSPMTDPITALLAFFGTAALGVALFWPDRGVGPRLRRIARLTRRVQLEDALKQLYKLEYDRLPATVESVAGGVQTTRANAIRLLQRLEENGLVTARDARFRLTEPGKAQAVHIVRAHRLWERFLADRTGMPPEDWHGHAEAREHKLSVSETQDLAAALGHPAYDPHGDPIPTSEGEMPVRSGVPLSALDPGERGLITHLEDEPKEIYRELVALELALLTPVECLAGEPGRVRFRAADRTLDVSSDVARNVTVEVSDDVEAMGSSRTLAEVAPGESATVAAISSLCRGPARRRLLDLGVVPGTVVHAVMQSAAGDPVAYDIRGALIALRRDQASHIQVEDAAPASRARAS